MTKQKTKKGKQRNDNIIRPSEHPNDSRRPNISRVFSFSVFFHGISYLSDSGK